MLYIIHWLMCLDYASHSKLHSHPEDRMTNNKVSNIICDLLWENRSICNKLWIFSRGLRMKKKLLSFQFLVFMIRRMFSYFSTWWYAMYMWPALRKGTLGIKIQFAVVAKEVKNQFFSQFSGSQSIWKFKFLALFWYTKFTYLWNATYSYEAEKIFGCILHNDDYKF